MNEWKAGEAGLAMVGFGEDRRMAPAGAAEKAASAWVTVVPWGVEGLVREEPVLHSPVLLLP